MNFSLNIFLLFNIIAALILCTNAGDEQNEAANPSPSNKKAKTGGTNQSMKSQLMDDVGIWLRLKEKFVKHYIREGVVVSEWLMEYFMQVQKWFDKMPEGVKNLYKKEFENLKMDEEISDDDDDDSDSDNDNDNESKAVRKKESTIVLEKMEVDKVADDKSTFKSHFDLINAFHQSLGDQLKYRKNCPGFKPTDGIKALIGTRVEHTYSVAYANWNKISMSLLAQTRTHSHPSPPINAQLLTKFVVSARISIAFVRAASKVSPFVNVEDGKAVQNVQRLKDRLKERKKDLTKILYDVLKMIGYDADNMKILFGTFDQDVPNVLADIQQMLTEQGISETHAQSVHIYWQKCLQIARDELERMGDSLMKIAFKFEHQKRIAKVVMVAEMVEKIRQNLVQMNDEEK